MSLNIILGIIATATDIRLAGASKLWLCPVAFGPCLSQNLYWSDNAFIRVSLELEISMIYIIIVLTLFLSWQKYRHSHRLHLLDWETCWSHACDDCLSWSTQYTVTCKVRCHMYDSDKPQNLVSKLIHKLLRCQMSSLKYMRRWGIHSKWCILRQMNMFGKQPGIQKMWAKNNIVKLKGYANLCWKIHQGCGHRPSATSSSQ